MKTLWIVYEQEIRGGMVEKRLIGSYETEEEARSIYTEILLDKPDDVDMEIVIEKKEGTDFSGDLLFNVLYLEMQMDQLSTLLNTQADIIKNLNGRLMKLEKLSN